MAATNVDPTVLRVAVGQIANRVGDVAGNAEEIRDVVAWADARGADVLVLPELALTGYPLDDLVTHDGFMDDADEALARVASATATTAVVLGTVRRVPRTRRHDTLHRDRAITAAVMHNGEVRGYYDKVLLPTYSVFDEQRVFAPGVTPARVWRLGDVVVGIAICEDVWSGDGPPEAQSAAGARALLLPNASPFERGKDVRRLAMVREVARRNGVPVVYVNSHGGVDDLVFDGGSLVVDGEGAVLHRSPQFTADRAVVDVPLPPRRRLDATPVTVHTRPLPRREPRATDQPEAPLDPDAQVWQALVVGTRDFARVHDFSEAVVGLNGGIESAVTAAVAVDALGADRVVAVTAPGRRTAPADLRDARDVAARLGVRLVHIGLEAVVGHLASAVHRSLDALDDVGEERLVLRTRAAALWAVADEGHRLLLATGNKTERSLGDVVMGGDFVGHFAPLADCSTTLVRRLAEVRNRAGQVIPASIIVKEVTAERRSGRHRLDWRAVDDVIERYVERMEPMERIPTDALGPVEVAWIVDRIMDAELDRRLGPMGVRVSGRAFGRDRRVPLGHPWRPRFAVATAAPDGGRTATGPAEEGPVASVDGVPPST